MILAIDLGNTFGWAIKQSYTIDSGWDRLSNKTKSEPGKRFTLFYYWLQEQDGKGIEVVYFEDVKRHKGLYAARAYCGYLAVLQSWAHKREIKCVGVGVGVIKKFWTGKGDAKKPLMIAEAVKRGFEITDDNQADALALLHCAIELGK